jgi:tripartite-type tricarboxylate transporter receptor subunit TctC
MKNLLVTGAFAALAAFVQPSQAQSYPTKPVHYVVAFTAGDAPDLTARLVGDRLSSMWGQQVLVENRVGAGGTIAGAYVAKAPPDGYTLFHCNIASNAIAQASYLKLPYDGLRDFAPVSRIGMTPNVVVVNPSLPTNSISEFVAYARANPGKLSYGSSGVGASPHLSMELFKSTAKIDMVHIAYKGANPALTDLIGGQIPAMISNIPSVLAHVQSGKVRALAVTGQRRSPQLPSVPTMVESGFPGFVVTSWYGMCAPAGTPTPILDKLHTDLMKVLQMPDLVQRFNELVVDAAPQSREEFTAFMRAEMTRWAQVVKEAGVPQQ